MNEWQTIAWFVGVSGTFCTFLWFFHQDAKKGLYKRVSEVEDHIEERVKRCEHVMDVVVSDCAKKKDDFITTKAFDRFENNLNTRFNGFDKNINHLTSRIDDLVIVIRNGAGKHE
jgi:hypothetical protein